MLLPATILKHFRYNKCLLSCACVEAAYTPLMSLYLKEISMKLRQHWCSLY